MDSHFFKIVYIKNLKELKPVPHMWEEDGVCWFPKLKKDIKMHQCNAASLPDKKNWIKYNCSVKVTGISTWHHANNTADTLCNDVLSSTSDEEEKIQPQLKRPRKNTMDMEEPSSYYSLDDEKLKNVPKSLKSIPSEVNIISDSESSEPSLDHLSSDVPVPTNVTIDQDATLTNSIDIATSQDIRELKDTVTSYHVEVCTLKSYFETKFVSLSLGIDNVLKTIQQREDTIVSNPSNDSNLETHFFPLSSKTAMQSFEDSLQNDDYQKKVIMHLRRIIGSGFPWTQACYKLVNVMFTKDLLVQYSWTGVSRTEKTKAPFNKLNNILAVFFHVIRFSDPSFTYSSREIFFRDKVLKHSQSRLNPKKNKENQSLQISAVTPVDPVSEDKLINAVDETDTIDLEAPSCSQASLLNFHNAQ